MKRPSYATRTATEKTWALLDRLRRSRASWVANKWLVGVVALSVLIRIPRVDGIIGHDAFFVIWMGRIASEGYFVNWAISPASLFGLYPFSSYPIGVPLVVAAMMLVGFSLESIALTFSIVTAVVGVYSSYALGLLLFRTKQNALLFSIFYSICHVFLTLTYYTVSARGLFLAIFPCFLYHVVKAVQLRESPYWVLKDSGLVLGTHFFFRHVAVASVLLVLLLLTHRLAVFIMAYGFVLVGYYVLRHLKHALLRYQPSAGTSPTVDIGSDYERESHRSGFLRREFRDGVTVRELVWWFLLVILVGGAYLVGILVIPIDPAKTVPYLFLSNETLLGVTVNLMIDYGLRLGLMSLFFPIGVIGAFYSDRGYDRRIIHLLLLPMVAFAAPMSTYASVVFLPVFGYYSVIGLDVIRTALHDRFVGIGSMAFVIAFGAAYTTTVAALPLWVLLLIVLVVILTVVAVVNFIRRWSSYRTLIGRSFRKWQTLIGQGPTRVLDRQAICIFLLSVVVVSLISTEGLLLQSENMYLSADEMKFIEFLDGQPTPGITFVPTPVIGRRLEAYGFPAVLSFNDDAALYFDWISPSNITANTELNIRSILVDGMLYTYYGPLPERIVWNSLFSLNLTDEADWTRARSIGLEFVIVEKTGSEYSSVFYSTYGEYFSELLYSTPRACEMVVDGQRMSLFRLS